MDPEGRRQAPPLTGGRPEDPLFEAPFDFDFFQAVRLLETLGDGRRPVGSDAEPAAESVRFSAHASIGFPASEIHDVRSGETGRSLIVSVAFMGLTGPSGVLPRYYTEMVIEEGEGGPLGDFLNIFDHRLISLFYRSWERNHPQLAANPETRKRFAGRILAFAGGQPTERPGPDRQWPSLDHVGLFSLRRRSAIGLKALLSDILNGSDSGSGGRGNPITVEVEQFVGTLRRLRSDQRTTLSRHLGKTLGRGTLIGRRIKEYQSKFRIRLGPLNPEQFQELRPDAPQGRFGRLVDSVRAFVGPEFRFDFEFRVAADGPSFTPLRAALTRRRSSSTLARTWLLSRPPRGDLMLVVAPGPPGRP